MFPIRDHNPSGQMPLVTILLMATNIVVFLGYWFLLSGPALDRFLYDWGLVPGRLLATGDWATVVSSMFLHGGWLHLAGNMLFLWIFGDNLEDLLGHGRFLLFYLAAGVGAAALQVAMDPGSGLPMVGASGAIAGVLGGYMLLYPRARVDVLFIFLIFFRIFAVPAWAVLGLWLGLQLAGGVTTPVDAGGVAYWAHAGGFVTGFVLALPLFLRLGGPGFWQRSAGRPDHPAAVWRATRIPVVRRR